MADMEETENTVEYGSGNVFSDLGLPDSEELMVKAKLLARIGQIISEQKLTQVAAARLLGMDQPKVSDLVRGKITRFSTERLIKALNALGQDVKLTIHPARAVRGRFTVTAP